MNRLWGQTPEAITSRVRVTDAPQAGSVPFTIQVLTCTESETDMFDATSYSSNKRKNIVKALPARLEYAVCTAPKKGNLQDVRVKYRPLQANKQVSKQAQDRVPFQTQVNCPVSQKP